MASTPPSIRVGTASWSEPEFVKAGWYPKGLPSAQQLPFYAARCDMVELNSSFYALPQARMKGSGKEPRRVVLELRHHDWLGERYRARTTAFLREQGVTLASIDGPPADAKHFTIMPAVDEITDGRLAYLRLHGRDAKAYLIGKTVAERFHYDYSETELNEVSERALHLSKEADEVHVVFNNNARDFAPVAAERLRRKLGQGSKLPESPRKQATLF